LGLIGDSVGVIAIVSDGDGDGFAFGTVDVHGDITWSGFGAVDCELHGGSGTNTRFNTCAINLNLKLATHDYWKVLFTLLCNYLKALLT
jgi:hypothetical protein